MSRLAVALVAAGLGLADLGSAQAQSDYPNRMVRVLNGAVAGGSSDTGARMLAAKLQERFGQTFIVENKPGATGGVAAAELARTEPNGYTLLLTASWHSTSAAIKKSLPYDSVKDFTFISLMMSYGMLIGVQPKSEINSLAELVGFAKANPGKLTYYSVGPGSAHHLVGESLLSLSGTEMVHVPYRGSSNAVPDFIGGRIDVMVETMTVALAQAKGGNVKPLAITSRAPLADLPGVPLAKSAVPGLEYESWLGLLGPAGMPADVVAKLNKAVREIVAMPDIAKRTQELGALPRATSPEEFRDQVAAEIALFKRVVEARKIPLQ